MLLFVPRAPICTLLKYQICQLDLDLEKKCPYASTELEFYFYRPLDPAASNKIVDEKSQEGVNRNCNHLHYGYNRAKIMDLMAYTVVVWAQKANLIRKIHNRFQYNRVSK